MSSLYLESKAMYLKALTTGTSKPSIYYKPYVCEASLWVHPTWSTCERREPGEGASAPQTRAAVARVIDTLALPMRLILSSLLFLQQMGISEESQESLNGDNIKEDNKQLQSKVDRNEKLIQHLQLEQTEHEHILKASPFVTSYDMIISRSIESNCFFRQSDRKVLTTWKNITWIKLRTACWKLDVYTRSGLRKVWQHH